MKILFLTAILCLAFSTLDVLAQNKTYNKTYLELIAGNREGTLEYLDYSANKRVRIKTYLTVTPSADGNSAEFMTVYDDFGRIIKDSETVKIDLAAKKYSAGKYEYKLDSVENGVIVLLGSGQDGEKVEPIRQTITFSSDSLHLLKETRTPWQFRNQTTLRRTREAVLAKKTFSAAQLKEDFNVLKQTLTSIHPRIYRYNTPEILEKIFSELEAKLKNPLSESEFFKLISQLTNRIRCGHTFPNPYNQDALARERMFGGKTHLPFYFRIVDGKIIVTENASPNDFARGSEITKINGATAKEIIEKLLTVTRADGENADSHRIQSIELTRFEAERYALFDWYFPLFFPLEGGIFAVEGVDFATKKKTKFQVSALTKPERAAEMEKRYGTSPTYDDGWRFEIQNDSTAYLKIANSITWRLKKIKFAAFLANAFAEMRAKKVDNLVIDLRGNGGGDMNVGYELSKYLAAKKLPVYAENRRLVRNVAPQSDLAKYVETYDDRLKTALQTGVSANLYQKAEKDYFEILPSVDLETFPAVTPAENNFRGRTFIISDASNASATFQFLNYIKENSLAQLVGQATGGSRQGINGGSYFFLRLPNSRIEIDVPVYFQAAPAAQKDESVAPDFLVNRDPQDIGKNFDRELMTIKKLIRRN